MRGDATTPEPWKTTEYSEGRNAYVEMLPVTENPYSTGNNQRQNWFAGWYEAKDLEKFGCPVGAAAAKIVAEAEAARKAAGVKA